VNLSVGSSIDFFAAGEPAAFYKKISLTTSDIDAEQFRGDR
jgi:hypothetical protein